MKINTLRHSLSHILAYAVWELYPEVKFGVGPAVENGFYYDFDFSKSAAKETGNKKQNKSEIIRITLNDLPKIERKMKELIKKNLKFKKKKIKIDEAIKLFKKLKQPYKIELLNEMKKGKMLQVTSYKLQDFIDLCKGPHIKSTKEIPLDSFKLVKVAGAYWKGNEKNKMLARIYGLAFADAKELKEYIKKREEAEKRDHRVLGKKLDLFIFSDLVGKGLPLFTKKGSAIKRELERFVVDEEIKRGYRHVCTPELAKIELYKTSGHYPYYKESMYPLMKVDEEELILRPMTCPHHFQLYAAKPRSYKELPFRIAELAKQFRYEKSGELTGLIRTRSFCLADAHIICQKKQINEEINNVLELIEDMALVFGLKAGKDYYYRLSLGDRKDKKKYFKDDKSWNFAENSLRKILKQRKSSFKEAEKEAAFYGPKIDIQMKNFAGKEDTAFTIQYDFVMPKRFNLFYIDKDGKRKEPVVIHRSSIGSIERIMAFLIEHYGGAFPLWLAPVQFWVIPIGEKQQKYAEAVNRKLLNFGLRSELKDETESMSKKIREGEIQKIPYLLVVGNKEIKQKSVSVRKRGGNNLGITELNNFINRIKIEIENKK